jgi:hypothetical protein
MLSVFLGQIFADHALVKAVAGVCLLWHPRLQKSKG